MVEKYSCPNCSKELSEADVVRGVCPHCHEVFDSLPQKIKKQKEAEWLKEKKNPRKKRGK